MVMDKKCELLKEECDNYAKYDNIYFFLSELISERGRESIKFYIKKNNIKNTVIYGAGSVARVLYEFIEKYSLCNVVGVIDKNENKDFGFYQFLKIDDLKNIEYDLIIVTPLSAYKSIIKSLQVNNINDNFAFVGELIDYQRRYEIYENGVHI
jgi:FlaA1/EpsC-like NDP-sugar epimerase